MLETVLIVDDDADFRESLAEVLRHEGYAPLTAANGAQALSILESTPQVCAVLLDLRMPHMDGDTFRWQQLSNPAIAAIPVIVVSANAQCSKIAGQFGAANCLRKPFPVERLLAVLEGVIRSCSAQAARAEALPHPRPTDPPGNSHGEAEVVEALKARVDAVEAALKARPRRPKRSP